eukprot:COSAG04_NODE_1056_length_8541_cov_4.364369_3_plen_161_part_00
MSTAANPAALFAGPALLLNGRRYASASTTIDRRGKRFASAQFALWPYPYTPSPTATTGSYHRPSGTYTAPNTLLLREVGEGIPAKLGPIFWTSVEIPAGFEEASRRHGVRPSSEMCAWPHPSLSPLLTRRCWHIRSAETQRDLALLANASHLPCLTGASA